jgi:hypothetical protein
MNTSRLARTAAPLLALGLAACAASSTSTHTAVATRAAHATTLSTAAFAAAADRICAIQNQREKALGPGLVNADIVTAARLPKAAACLEAVIAIRSYGRPALTHLAARGTAADRAFVRDFQKVVADYQAAATAAGQGNLAGFRAAFSRVAPHGYPTGPDMIPLIRVSREFPFKACGQGSGL